MRIAREGSFGDGFTTCVADSVGSTLGSEAAAWVGGTAGLDVASVAAAAGDGVDETHFGLCLFRGFLR